LRAAEILQVVAAGVAAEVADLQQELAVLGELQDLRILSPLPPIHTLPL